MKKNLLTLLIIFLSVIYGGNNLSAQNYVAQVGSTKYENIADAIAAWETSPTNTTMTLLDDVTLTRTITLKSTEHHTLNLSTYTMTAASGTNAIEITPLGVGTASKSCLTINADATNPGGITATKSCIYYKNSDKNLADRACTTINGGIFNGSINSNSSATGQLSPHYVFNGGTFNAAISLTHAMLDVTGGTFNSSFSCTGISTSRRLISGGTFKSWLFMTADASNKFGVGSSIGTYDIGVYVDEYGYLVVGGPVKTGPKTNQKFDKNYNCYTETYNWSTYLKYSSAEKNGLYYNSIKKALDNNNKSTSEVLVHQGTLDLSAGTTKYTYNGTIILPNEDSEFTVIYKTEPELEVESGIDGIDVATNNFENVPSTGLTTRVYSLCPNLGDNDECPHVARACGKHYDKLNDALNDNVTDGNVITLIKNTSENVIKLNKNVTINFNGKTCTNTNTNGLVIPNGKNVTLTGGTLIAKNADFVISTSGNLTMQNMTINGTVEYLGGEMFTDKAFTVSAKKYFEGVEDHTQNWSTISTPIVIADIPATAGKHDLYRFDEPEQEWEYYNDADGQTFTQLELGRGYLYANAADITFELTGELNIGSVEFPLSYTKGNSLAGFNMIGNPFTYSIDNDNMSMSSSVKLADGFYVVGNDGKWTPKIDGKIAPMESVLIQANGKGTLTMSPANTGSKRAARNENSYLTINVASKTHSDVAYVSFNDGMGLDKINHRNPDNPMLYIPVEGKNYAIAMMDKDVKEVPVYFNANRMAEYTISIEQKNCEFSSVVLVDKLTGVETNLLIEDYSFMARSFDNADRFIIRMSIEDNDDSETENFAYVSNGSIVIEKIEGNANIRIFDIMGRHIMGANATGNANIPVETMSTGMYIIQMSDDNGVKVQKIIIE